jgi:hypothetical protein
MTLDPFHVRMDNAGKISWLPCESEGLSCISAAQGLVSEPDLRCENPQIMNAQHGESEGLGVDRFKASPVGAHPPTLRVH